MCKETDDLMVFHGTSQDMSSENELTVKVVNQAMVEGREVFQVGGPGSTERAIKATRRQNGSYLDEIDLPLDYGFNLLSGVAFGDGIKDIVGEGLEEFMKKVSKQKTIHIIGFSRGAVAAASMLEQAGKYMEKNRMPMPKVHLTLLDPVPGPFMVDKQVLLPRCVSELNLIISKHEGRPGFQHLDLAVSGPLKFFSDTSIGVHGDIGGSTRSSLARFHANGIMDLAGLGGSSRLSDGESTALALDSLVEWESYANKLKAVTRTFEDRKGVWIPAQRADVEAPSSSVMQQLDKSLLGRLLTSPWTPALNERATEQASAELARFKSNVRFADMLQRRTQQNTTMMHNPRPVLGPDRRVVYPRPVVRPLPQFSSRVIPFVTSMLKKFK